MAYEDFLKSGVQTFNSIQPAKASSTFSPYSFKGNGGGGMTTIDSPAIRAAIPQKAPVSIGEGSSYSARENPVTYLGEAADTSNTPAKYTNTNLAPAAKVVQNKQPNSYTNADLAPTTVAPPTGIVAPIAGNVASPPAQAFEFLKQFNLSPEQIAQLAKHGINI